MVQFSKWVAYIKRALFYNKIKQKKKLFEGTSVQK